MLQQTTVQAVIPYYTKWLELFPDMQSLSRAPLQKILKAWQGLGYYQRAKNMHRAAGIIITEHSGRLPREYSVLLSLPGFGPYTAAAVLSLAFDLPYPVLEANTRRLLMRLRKIDGPYRSSLDNGFLEFLSPLLPEKNIGLFNQALMELGSLVCRPQNPQCHLCPVTDSCLAFSAGEQEIIPPPKKRTYTKIEAVVAVVRRDGKYLIQKRPSRGLMADLWEFPGGKREKGETLEQCLAREVREELHTDIREFRPLITVRHAYTRFQVTLYAYECVLDKNPRTSTNIRVWAGLKELHRYPFPSGSAKIIRFLEKRENRRE
jgi:A/G-specific adenine glycosylase